MTITSAVRRAAQINARGLAIQALGCERNWGEFADRIARLAGGLVSLGVRPGDRIALLANNSPAQLELNYATFWAGACLVPLNYRLAGSELSQILSIASPRLLFVDDCFQPLLGDILAGGDCRTIRIGAHEHMALFENVPLRDRSEEAVDGLAGLFFTGGTTGKPKGVMLRHDSFVVQGLEMRQMLCITPEKKALHALPLFHMGGTSVAQGVTMGAGVHSFVPGFDPALCLKLIDTCNITHLSLVPTMIAMLMEHAASAGQMAIVARLEMLCYGAAPIPPDLLDHMISELPTVDLRQFYGMTELCGACVTLEPADHRPAGGANRSRAAGRVVSSMEIAVRAEDGTCCPIGVAGEVVARGPLVMSGYWKDAENSAAMFSHDGWLKTGDVGVLDADGYLTILDRTKDMIISGGENIYTAEVEAVLSAHDAVLECAVIGILDDHWGEIVHAVIVLNNDCEAAEQLSRELGEYCRTRLAGYKCPRSYSFRVSPLPLSAVGKVKKDLLRREVAAVA